MLNKFLYIVIYIYHFVFRRYFFFLLSKFFNKIYSFYLSIDFNSIGEHSLFKYPCFLLNPKKIKIGKNFKSERGLRLEVFDILNKDIYIEIGDSVYINWNCHIGSSNYIYIGNNVLIGSNVFITDHFHGEINSDDIHLTPINRKNYSKGPVIISDNVWIGEFVSIMPNVSIGKNCIIGSNSVVTHSFSDNTVIAGNPAKIIKIL
jgi:serine acetyltransferase